MSSDNLESRGAVVNFMMPLHDQCALGLTSCDLAELMGRSDGSQSGTRVLTWAYASFLEASRARKEVQRLQAPR